MPIRPRTPLRSTRSGFWRHWTLWIWFVVALVFCGGGVAMWKSGRWLVKEDRFEKVRWGVVLAGESRDCERSDAAIRMFQEERIDTLVISATRAFKNRYNSEFMVDYYVEQGVPRDRVFEFRQDAYSTLEEARLLVRQFRLQNLDTVLIITSSYHTARTRRIFRKLAQGYPVVLVASADYNLYDPNAWWSNREGRKIWFDEWARTVFSWMEVAKAPPEIGKAEFQGLTPDVWTSRTADNPASTDLPAADTASVPSPSDSLPAAADPDKTAPDSAQVSSQQDGRQPGAEDSAHAARTDSLKAHKDSSKTAEAKSADSKTGSDSKAEPKDAVAKKSPPKAEKKPAESAAKKPATGSKGSSKSAEKKSDKKSKKKD